MRLFFIIFLLFIILSCNSESQNSQNVIVKDSINTAAKEADIFNSFFIDSSSDIKTGTKERSSTFIKIRLESLTGNSYKAR